ncbi:unnamed protein product [Dibothriocephalus latus]|uniref:m7GpppX diphosphatase n=1 Tax=Dibothriocephalus latus TaxID=60516 RepID=A0A3P7MCE2_DIBLA|nr:unnamed protein product [Dibothriocephalus latus]
MVGGDSSSNKVEDCSETCSYKPANMQIVRILLNDQLGKLICLHTKFNDSPDQDAIVLLQKTPFPNDVQALCEARLGLPFSEDKKQKVEGKAHKGSEESLVFPEWKAGRVTDNDIYHRRLVQAGLEDLNTLNMTVIHPAGPQHFVKYTASGRRLVLETPKIYSEVVLPFLAAKPGDLAWVDNLLNGTAEVDKVLFTDPDESLGFTLAVDFRWDGRHSSDSIAENRAAVTSASLSEDQIFAYFHYPPTFYRLHMHFAHVDCAPDGGTQTGKAYLAEDVIANLEQDGEFYARRTMPIFLRENQPLLAEIRKATSMTATSPENKQ